MAANAETTLQCVKRSFGKKLASALNSELFGIGCSCLQSAAGGMLAIHALENSYTYTRTELEELVAYVDPHCCGCVDPGVIVTPDVVVIELIHDFTVIAPSVLIEAETIEITLEDEWDASLPTVIEAEELVIEISEISPEDILTDSRPILIFATFELETDIPAITVTV